MAIVKIKHRYTDAVLFSCDVDDSVDSGLRTRVALEKATASGAYLSDANLSGAYLRGAYLRGADLRGAYLSDANLSDANLSGAKFSEDKLLIGSRPFMAIGPIGSRCAMVTLWITDKGPMVRAGCFTGTLDEFAEAVKKTHGDNEHGKEYEMAILMFESHCALWIPVAT